jgi:integrase
MKMKLTGPQVAKLVCGAKHRKDELARDTVQRGLIVRVGKQAAAGSLDHKNYLVQYSLGGRKRRIPLGPCAAITLGVARREALKLMAEVAGGRDPALDRAKRKQIRNDQPTLDQDIARWATIGLSESSERYRMEAPRSLRRLLTKRLNQPTASLSRETVVAIADELVAAGRLATARALASHGGALCGCLIKRGSLKDNVFAKLPLPAASERSRVLDDEEIRLVWLACEGMGHFGTIVRLLLLTGQRLSEIAELQWSELSPDLALLTLPSERTKNNIVHTVPLSRQARALLAPLPRTGPFVFPGPLSGQPWSNVDRPKKDLDQASGVTGWVLHDCRRTLATGMQRLGVRLEVVEGVLNHVSGSRSGVIGIYQRYDFAAERRLASQAWGDHVEAIVEGREAASNIVALRG